MPHWLSRLCEARRIPPVAAQAKATRQLQKRGRRRFSTKSMKKVDDYYTSIVSLRSVSVGTFLGNAPPQHALQITSINEDRLLRELGLPKEERKQIEGLKIRRFSSDEEGSGLTLSKEQLSARAIVRLAANPPPPVGMMQRRTAIKLLRPYPLGLRFSGKNMSPLPGWLSGCQHVALNMSNVDLPNQLHFALFHGSGGFLLKPPEMLVADSHADKKEKKRARRHSAHDDVYWPPPRQTVHQVAVEILSLHNLPKVCASRARQGRPMVVSQHERPLPGQRLRVSLAYARRVCAHMVCRRPLRCRPFPCVCSVVSNDHATLGAEARATSSLQSSAAQRAGPTTQIRALRRSQCRCIR
eukprot:6695801-Prymnesium_polylepis.1